jgi:hypothetical protein
MIGYERQQYTYYQCRKKEPDVLVLLQRLVEGKDDLAVGETVQGDTLLLHPLHCSFLPQKIIDGLKLKNSR